ncbi:tetratricopeptide repeat protein [Hephaestia sp. GCM10023244]|uniref:tetratricopeptide repeat protein n=1 Tax=unclassified Hephaestia TaxID=2631281 RepID=UPI0020775707|nr:tetratricopeptide repeat protein [Hephaestia sp. MAHUQ-44]MCM8730601.1 tetratricopeptide repeat protein [Hephaestia sp. MAHUQ-44]
MTDRSIRRGHVACALVAASIAAPMLNAETANFTADLPAPHREASFLGSIALEPIAGQDGDRLAFALERALAAPAADGAPAFTVLAGRRGPAPEGLVSGQVTTGVEENRVEASRRRCVEWDTKDAKNDEGEKGKRGDRGKCIKHANVKERCRQRVITVEADIRIVRVADNRVVYAAHQPKRDEVTWCRDDDNPRAAEPVIADLINAIAGDVRSDITPHVRDFRIRFREGRDRMPKPIAARFKQAVKISEVRPDEACAAWQAIDAEMPDHPSVVFNLGLCAEARGAYERAMAHYRRVQQLDPKARDARDALARVPQLMAGAAEAEERAAMRSWSQPPPSARNR